MSRRSLVSPAPFLRSTCLPISSMTPYPDQVCLVQLLRSSRCDIRPVWVASQHRRKAPAPTWAKRYAEDPFVTSACLCTWAILTSKSVAVASKRLSVKGYAHDKLSAMLEEYMRNPLLWIASAQLQTRVLRTPWGCETLPLLVSPLRVQIVFRSSRNGDW